MSRFRDRAGRRALSTKAGTAGLAVTMFLAQLAAADVILKLQDGKVLKGASVSRDGDLYLLQTASGAIIPLPSDLVVEVGLIGEKPEAPRAPSGPEPPTGFVESEPRVLAGVAVEPPRTSEQLAVLGEPAQFQRNVVETTFKPSYWVMDPDQHNFAPSTWAKGPIDPTWVPESAFDANEDVLEDSRSTWRKGPIDSSWKPTDGFAKK